jgi:hypothetical protein
MNTLIGTLKFAGRASLQVLKTGASFATATVATVCAFVGWAFLIYRISRISQTHPHLGKIGDAIGHAGKYLILAAFAGAFYLTFKLLEPRMAARKKLLVASLGIVLPLASHFWLHYTPTLGVTELFQKATPPGPPKPYEDAIYDVYSGLLNGERAQRSLWDKFTNPIPEGVLIRIDTTIETGRPWPFRPVSLLAARGGTAHVS